MISPGADRSQSRDFSLVESQLIIQSAGEVAPITPGFPENPHLQLDYF